MSSAGTVRLGPKQLREVFGALEEVVRWTHIFLHLGMPKVVADKIEMDHPRDISKQKEAAISWWLCNSLTASWKELSDALRLESYGVLASQLYEIDDIIRYLELIPPANQYKLDKELDWDNDTDRDLTEISQYITNWETKLIVPFGLTEADRHIIKVENDPVLRKRKFLHLWKEKKGFDATYRNFLKCVVAGRDHITAKKICELKIFQEPPLQQGDILTQLGGSHIYQQPTVQLCDVLRALEELVEWRELLVYLDMPMHVAKVIEMNHPRDIIRQKEEAIDWWLRNSPTASWKQLVDALQLADYAELASQVKKERVGEVDDIVCYLELIPLVNQCKLDEELDWDNDMDRDLTEISQYITNWEANLRVSFGLTEADVRKIKQEENPDTRQREVLRIWKGKQGLDATYRNLLKCVVGKAHQTAQKICELQIFQETPLQPGDILAQKTELGSSEIHQQPTVTLGIPELSDVLQALQEVVRWRELFLKLGMPKHVADTIEMNHPRNVKTQKEEAIRWWLCNSHTASWRELADAVQSTGYGQLASQLLEAKVGEIIHYLELIPPDNQYKLDEELDWDNDTDRDLTEISQYITNWEDNLVVPFGLTEADMHKIKQEENPGLRQKKFLQLWKAKEGLNATYKNLLKCVVVGKDDTTAKKIFEIEIFQGPSLPPGDQRTKLKGSDIYQHPTVQLWDVLRALKELVEWRNVLIYLNMPTHVADTIEMNHPGDIARQKEEAIAWWLNNSPTASWKELANALRSVGHSQLASQLCDERDGDIVRYLEMIPPDNQYKLDEELDWDNDTDRDLTKIAQYITDWEANLRVPLELTETDVHKIQQEENPDTRQRAVLRVWKEKQSFDATYRNLLKCLARKDHKTAKKICGLEIFQESPRQQTAQETKVGGSEIHQQPAVELHDVLLALKEVVEWRDLLLQLEMPKHVADAIEMNYPRDITRQKEDAIAWWLIYSHTPSWKILADALQFAGYKELASQLHNKMVTSYGRTSRATPSEKYPTHDSGDDPFHVVTSKITAPAINRDQDTSEQIIIGYSETTASYISEAESQVYGLLKNCQPLILALLVTDDNKQQQSMPGLDSLPPGPLADVEEVHSIKSTLEDNGVMVISINDRSKEYLFAVLSVLATVNVPKCCELFWLLFTGHGSHGAFFVNGESVLFNQLIQKASEIQTKYAAFFFECCQASNMNMIKVAEIKKQYVAVYSAPPNQVFYRYSGVGLMMIVLADILKDGYTGLFSELHRLVCQRMLEKMIEILAVPEESRESFIASNLPVQTSTMYDDFSFYRKISGAMQPVIKMEFDTEVPLNHTTVVSVQNPNRIVHHPSDSKFELVKDVVELKVGDQHERVRLAEVDASFGENVVIDITLPPQASQLSGELWVGCEYGDGRIEYCNPYEVAKLPCYDLPVVRMCTVHDQENQCDVAVEFEPNITHPDHNYYNIESVEIGFHDTYTLSWCPLYHCDGCDSTTVVVVLPPSQDLVQRELQVAVKYFNCSTPMFSKSYIVDQQPICSSDSPESSSPSDPPPLPLPSGSSDSPESSSHSDPLPPPLPSGSSDSPESSSHSDPPPPPLPSGSSDSPESSSHFDPPPPPLTYEDDRYKEVDFFGDPIQAEITSCTKNLENLPAQKYKPLVKYFNCSTPMFSKSYIVDQQPICSSDSPESSSPSDPPPLPLPSGSSDSPESSSHSDPLPPPLPSGSSDSPESSSHSDPPPPPLPSGSSDSPESSSHFDPPPPPLTYEDDRYKEVDFFGDPIQAEITSSGGEVGKLEEVGISLIVPEGALRPNEKPLKVVIRPAIGCPLQLPDGYKPASPVYLIEHMESVDFLKNVNVQIQHWVNLTNDGDCKDMGIFSSKLVPSSIKGRTVYNFSKVEGKTTFSPKNSVGSVELSHFCALTIGTASLEETESRCSVRFYRNMSQAPLVGREKLAVICICVEQGLICTYCNKAISQGYAGFEERKGGRSTESRMFQGDSVTIQVEDGWEAVFDKNQRNPTISKRDVYIHDMMQMDYQAFKLHYPDYPPKVAILNLDSPIPSKSLASFELIGFDKATSFTYQAPPKPDTFSASNFLHKVCPGLTPYWIVLACVIFAVAFYAYPHLHQSDCHGIHRADSNILEKYLNEISDYANNNMRICKRLQLKNCNQLATKQLTPFVLAEEYLSQTAEPCWEDIVRMLCKDFNERNLAKRVADERMNCADYQQYCR